MNILAFDTCFDGCSVCVAERHGEAVVELGAMMERFETGHAERLIPMIGETMQMAGLELRSDRAHRRDGRPRHLHGDAHRRRRGARSGARLQCQDCRCLEPRGDGEGRQARDSLPRPWRSSSTRGAAKSTRNCSVSAARLVPNRHRSSSRSMRPRSWAALVRSYSSARVPHAVAAAASRDGRHADARLPDLLPDAIALAQIAATLEPSEAPLVPFYLRPPDAKPQDGKAIARA